MDNFFKLILILWGLFFVFLFYLIIDVIKFKNYLNNIKKEPCKCKKELEKIDIYNKLPPELQKTLQFKIKRFLNEKKFIPKFMEINNEIKILIAFYACMPTVAYKNFCYPSLKYIYVYPHTIIKKHIEQNGIVKKEMLISGESLGESVVIAWDEAKKEIFHYKKRNVIIHEFAHELDFEEGSIDGIPVFAYQNFDKFKNILNKNFEKAQKEHIIDEYAFTNKAEFFAVTTEYFFLKPHTLKIHYPLLYAEYKNIFKINPEKFFQTSS